MCVDVNLSQIIEYNYQIRGFVGMDYNPQEYTRKHNSTHQTRSIIHYVIRPLN